LAGAAVPSPGSQAAIALIAPMPPTVSMACSSREAVALADWAADSHSMYWSVSELPNRCVPGATRTVSHRSWAEMVANAAPRAARLGICEESLKNVPALLGGDGG
jgi:hypothetical protein